ncbi:MAG TPA: xanthine dehydrogenase family protein molybdopterin-binding subunit [Terriglobales bacterium]|nr:xanthine dehydrogenase family protein molybdopterin-binding subunit [Terriglobales bacterium]
MKTTKLDRREFLKSAGLSGAALVLGFYLPGFSSQRLSGQQTVKANAWITIDADNTIRLLTEVPEMGQGPRTVGAMMLADELEADWSKITVEQAPVIPGIYKNLHTGGSGGTASAWDYMRRAGAQARELLISAAASKWKVSNSECIARESTVVHKPSGRKLNYGELVSVAASLPVPDAANIPLKTAKDFRYIGKPIPRVDTPAKTTGSGIFGIDVRVPGMLYAVIARCPQFGGKAESFDAAQARAVPGVRAVFPVPAISFLPKLNVNANVAGGIAVVADSTWSAMQGRKALKISWDKGPHAGEDTDNLRKALIDGASAEPQFVVVNQGSALSALASATRKIEVTYEFPFQAHATMEPMNTTVHVRENEIEVWSPTQIGNIVQQEIAALSGLPPERVTVHMMLCGGSFGRRYQWDYSAEAWLVAKQMQAPVQLLWTREDDMQHDFYLQHSYHRLSGALDPSGGILAWSHRIVSTPIRAVFDSADKLTPKHLATQEVGGADVVPYSPANLYVDYVPVQSGVPRAWWRSVEHSFNALATECFMDELAHSADVDPLRFRMGLLREDRKLPWIMWPDDPPVQTRRFRNVLQLAAEKSGWGAPLPKGHGRGIACCPSFGSYIAHVAEVSVSPDGEVRIHRVVSAVDCGTAVNPDGVRAMTESGVNFGLTPVLSGEITVQDGAVEQSNFDGYQVLRIPEAPDIEVYIADSGEEIGGMGETAVPPLAPAVLNAIFAASGKRVRKLPVDAASLAASSEKTS